MEDDFKALNCELVGLSINGLFSHIAWLRKIEEKIEFKGVKNIEVKFSLVEDISIKVAKKYGMVQPKESETQAVRAVFFINPVGVIKSIIYYPQSLGRNFDEIKRTLIVLQTAEEFGVVAPTDWRPGDYVIAPPSRVLWRSQR